MREGRNEERLGEARHAHQQRVAFREDRHQDFGHDVRLADDDLRDVFHERLVAALDIRDQRNVVLRHLRSLVVRVDLELGRFPVRPGREVRLLRLGRFGRGGGLGRGRGPGRRGGRGLGGGRGRVLARQLEAGGQRAGFGRQFHAGPHGGRWGRRGGGRRCRCRGGSAELNLEVAEAKFVSVANLGVLDALAVNERAVGAVVVVEPPAAALGADRTVVARHAPLFDGEVAVGRAPERDALGGERDAGCFGNGDEDEFGHVENPVGWYVGEL